MFVSTVSSISEVDMVSEFHYGCQQRLLAVFLTLQLLLLRALSPNLPNNVYPAILRKQTNSLRKHATI